MDYFRLIERGTVSLRTNPLLMFLQNVVSRLGVYTVISKIILTEWYEQKYDIAFQRLLKLGEAVWEIGASIGFYTNQFSEKVGDNGFFCSFESSPKSYKKLSSSCSDPINVSIRYMDASWVDPSHVIAPR